MDRGYIVLDLKYLRKDEEEHLHPVVLLGENDVVLVDCGYPGSLEQLEAQLNHYNINPQSITKLLLTHQDYDHMGAAAEIKEKYPAIKIVASREEEPYISGKLKNLRLQQVEELQAQLPEEEKEWGRQFYEQLRKVRPVEVDEIVSPGDEFEWGNGCRIIDTPGHTPGHISIHGVCSSYMITGDAAVVEQNMLTLANPEYCLDIDKALDSLEKIFRWRCNEYICYHSGILCRLGGYSAMDSGW